ncbi:heat shock protein Hsp33 [Ameyamaea chiangmaiensis NBRC 103196]|uniref:Hsp33 family molecular chaperone HslO n=1 Tax=Ameyamaea chiangmaiensis TaxID=442969 RepID=A0A850PH80_9PROT|nr:Hsp33 family molecular chaperone HslO [Ameyamaea chiangmaiensis]MBS4076434.1 Hsp33 family molecular chaperone HslO [Ameyamaea chiangmaiensis]NVN41770.1 Hsp33 family molecular chaperone HslO [Ameyamaea chiangmaiensis]GBQ61870.1 heat shock protein Hsp33 [Ameyamaea chiangmaiensis NBRC 103196]
MIDTPAFLDSHRPDVPDLVVPGGITPFHLGDSPVRGRLVRLGQLADVMLTRHDNEDAVSRLSGQALALVAGLASALKFQGSFALQVKGDGPVTMLLADCTDAGSLRFYARANVERLAALLDTGPAEDSTLLGEGYIAFTVDQGPDTERHQGIVDIARGSLSDMAMHYFETSEQHACWVRLTCDLTPSGWRASALILERIAAGGGTDIPAMPEDDAAAQDAWETALALASTVTDAELLSDALTPERIIHRLFHSLTPHLDHPRALAFGCRCSRARLSGILETFAQDDLDHMAVDGDIVMTCEFCAVDFRFPREDIGRHSA